MQVYRASLQATRIGRQGYRTSLQATGRSPQCQRNPLQQMGTHSALYKRIEQSFRE